MAESTISARGLNRATLARQMLLARERVKPVPAIERLAGMQAQWPRPPFVGLWTRLEGFTRDDLLKAIERRDVVRGTFMRGTIHLVSAKDYLAFRQTLQPALSEGLSVIRDRMKDVDVPPIVKQGRAFFMRGPATFSALRDHLKSGAKNLDERALAYIIRMHLPLLQTPDGRLAVGLGGLIELRRRRVVDRETGRCRRAARRPGEALPCGVRPRDGQRLQDMVGAAGSERDFRGVAADADGVARRSQA